MGSLKTNRWNQYTGWKLSSFTNTSECRRNVIKSFYVSLDSNKSLFQPKITDFLVEVLLFRFLYLYLWLTSSKFFIWWSMGSGSFVLTPAVFVEKAVLKLSCHLYQRSKRSYKYGYTSGFCSAPLNCLSSFTSATLSWLL